MSAKTRVSAIAKLVVVAITSSAAVSAIALDFTEAEIRLIRQHTPLGQPPPDPSNRWADDPAAARFGQYLFFDTRLSDRNDVSCATCHDPRRGFATGTARGTGTGGHETARHVPTLLNNAYNRWFFWDGRADSAWSQATQPLENPSEQAGDRLQIAHRVSRIAELRAGYEAVFGKLPDLSDTRRFPEHAAPMPHDSARARAWGAMSAADQQVVDRVFTNLTKAIAAFERKLVSRDSAFDRFAAAVGSREPVDGFSESAQRGLRLFIGRGNCRLCHSGPNFSDGEFHDTALPRAGGLRDTGRWGGTRRLLADPFNSAGPYSDGVRPPLRFVYARQDSSGQFKTPTLRDVARTAPYMHTGQFERLRDVLRFYSTREGIPRTHGEQGIIQRLDLSESELDDLEAFLQTLSGRPLPPELSSQPAPPTG